LALIGIIKCLSKELYKSNIRVNGVAPSIVKTKFSSKIWEGREHLVEKKFEVNRLAEVEDVSGVIAFLASKDAAYVNGEVILITGKCSPRL